MYILLKYVNILHLQVKKNVYYLKRQWFIVLNIIFFLVLEQSATFITRYRLNYESWEFKKTPDICLPKVCKVLGNEN